MKVGDLVKLYASARRNGAFAGKLGLIVNTIDHQNGTVQWSDYVINIDGDTKRFHRTQIEKVVQ